MGRMRVQLMFTAALVIAALGLASSAPASPVLERFHTTIDMNGAVLTCSTEDVCSAERGRSQEYLCSPRVPSVQSTSPSI